MKANDSVNHSVTEAQTEFQTKYLRDLLTDNIRYDICDQIRNSTHESDYILSSSAFPNTLYCRRGSVNPVWNILEFSIRKVFDTCKN